MSNYDRAVTVFSPDGHLLQVKYAHEAVLLSSPVVGVRGTDSVVIASERKLHPQLFEERTEKNVMRLDDQMAIGFAGLRADGRVLVNKARAECQIHRLSLEDPPTLDYITRFIAQLKQIYTQRIGQRPFGISCLIGGIDDGGPRLYQTDPGGNFYEWKAAVIGRNEKKIRSYLEQNYAKANENEEGALHLAIKALLNNQIPHSPREIEVAIVKKGMSAECLTATHVKSIIATFTDNKLL